MWALARIIIICLNMVSLAVANPNNPVGDWRVALIASAVFAPALYVWLTASFSSGSAVRANVHAWNAPFYPITRYPLQFWLLASYTCILGGLSGLVALIGFGRGNELITEVYLTIGISILVTLGVWLRRNLKADRGRSVRTV